MESVLVEAVMVKELNSQSRRRRGVRRVILGLGIAGAVASAVAFRSFFARPGEDPLRFIPKDAILFGTMDLSPSPSQTLVFKKIDDALSRNGLDKKLDSALTDMVLQNHVGDLVRPYAKRGASFALLTPEKPSESISPDNDLVAYFALSDGPAVAKILKENGKRSFWRGTQYYQIEVNGPCLMVVNDMLAVAATGKPLSRVEKVMEGSAPSILDRPDFAAERAKIANDANLMVFLAPEALAEFSKEAPEEAKMFAGTYKWMSLGLAIRDGGLAINYSGSFDASAAKWLNPLAHIAPIRSDLMAIMPKGAYGITATAQPSKYFESTEAALKDQPDGGRALREMEKGLADNLNLSLHQDLVPAFQGNAIIGFYPSEASDKVAGIDVLVVFDDKNGATPGALAERLRESIERQAKQQQPDTEPFESSTEGDVKKYRLSADVEKEMQDSFAEETSGEDDVVDSQALMKDKTITWAIVGETVVLSSNQKLLDRTVSSLKGRRDGMNSDSAWAPSEKNLIDGSQTLFALSISRMAEGFENTFRIEKMGEDTKSIREIVESLKALKDPFYLKTRTEEGKTDMGLFIPMDYDRMIDLIGEHSK